LAIPLVSVTAEVDGLLMHARVGGADAPPGRLPVVLVHGLSVSSAYMVPVGEILAEDFPVYAPDLPGFGRSGKPDEALDVPALADALARWMDGAGVPRAALLGNSLGCQVIVELAVRHPERVARLILVGPTCDPCLRRPRVVLDLLKDAARERPSLLPLHALDDVRAGPRRILRTFRYALRHPMRRRLREVRAPALVVRGESDPLVSRRWAREVTARLTRGRLVEIPDAPHALNYSAPAPLAEAVRAFLLDGDVDAA
jgi:pimeloyl-ACP methyl ester carboxylesterase